MCILSFFDLKCKMIILINLKTIKEYQWQRYQERLSIIEQEKVFSFLFENDQKRAFCSLLLQKYLIKLKYHNLNSNICYTREVSFASSSSF